MPGLKLDWREGIAYAVGTFNGKRVRKSLGTRDPKIAEEQRALYEARLWKRHSYGEKAVRTFEEAALSYLEQGGDGRFLPAIIRHFKGRALSAIAPGDIREMAVKLYPKASAATRNRQAITPARAVINHGHSREWCDPIRVEVFKTQKSRKHKPVSGEWLAAFKRQCEADALPHLAALVQFMHDTAARISEALRVTGADLDLGGRTALLGKTKTDEDVVRHLTAELTLMLGRLPLVADEPVFLYTDRSSVRTRMKAVCRRAGLPYRPPHSVGRHSFGTNAMAAGAKVKSAMDAGGWKSARLFMETYVHTDGAGREVAELFDRKSGPIGAELPQQKPKQRYHYGKKSEK